MNEKWLYNLLKDGVILDNQSYIAVDGRFKNTRLGDVFLKERKNREHNKFFNNNGANWEFLYWVSLKFENLNSEQSTNNSVLFSDREYEHNTDEPLIKLSGNNWKNFKLETGNLIGVVSKGSYSLKIGSRFGDQFLKYIIADADGFLEVDDSGGDEFLSGYEWLIAYLWNIKLKRAFRLGLPKSYVTQDEVISKVRGSIDPIDYFRNKKIGRYKCSYREHSYKNPAVSLFIEAFKTIEQFGFSQKNRNIYNALLSANGGIKRTRKELLKTPYFKNPFYNDYNRLIDLSKQIIQHGGADFDSSNDSSAFLFDISMLFEYFIRKLIKRNGITIQSKFEKTYRIPSGVLGSYVRKLEPDIILERGRELFVFDVKYKSFDFTYGVKREDLFQLHTYIGQVGNKSTVKGCGFIYPLSEANWTSQLEQSEGIISSVIQQQDRDIPFHIIFLKIPDEKIPEFNEKMNEQCKVFLELLQRKVMLN